ncbi:STY0301 family protein [Nitrospirillum sp. BR 11752]|uniref:STY0301 family protein n=1 Tax=Nitrospirillum sp. BR 11752 TaxID=3104293 RepID=UPI002EB19289|nr:STY0301 family protein [Nitrospirillum sp. BR 11752]
MLISAASFGIANAACAAPPDVCPARPGDKVKSLNVFDGKPEDMFNLAPDDEGAGQDTFTVGEIYKAGRMVTIRCIYTSGTVTDVELKDKVEQCKASEKKSGEVTISCH